MISVHAPNKYEFAEERILTDAVFFIESLGNMKVTSMRKCAMNDRPTRSITIRS